MQKVKNGKCIRRFSRKAMQASKTRNIIAVIAIILTTVLFTAIFTIGMSLIKSFEQQNFRQVGGDSHGIFKDLEKEQVNKLRQHSLIRESGLRWILGMPEKAPFLKSHVEVSYTEPGLAKHMFCVPKEGRLPKEGTMEAATDTRVLKLLGVEPKIGETFTLTYTLGFGTSHPEEITQTFTLSGWWDYDNASIASHVLITKSCAEEILAGYERQEKTDLTGQYDLYVMFSNSRNIEGKLLKILSDSGYQNEDSSKDNYIALGVNWGYMSAQYSNKVDFTTFFGLAAALFLIILSGYLIIYNIFRISVSRDIRFYGLIKTIGMTGKQIRRVIRQQVWVLSGIGIPIGLIIGWMCGAILTPKVMAVMSYKTASLSVNPAIFIGAALFSLITVSLSSRKPAKIAGAVSPVEAVRYTESSANRKREKKREKGAKPVQMAMANLGRSKSKTVLVILSLSLAVLLLNLTYTFTNGFDMDKYLRQWVCTDFIFGHADYFNFHFGSEDQGVTEDMIADLENQGGITESGRIYGQTSFVSHYIPKKLVEQEYARFYEGEELQELLDGLNTNSKGNYENRVQLYGMEALPLSKLTVLEGDLNQLGKDFIAAVVGTDNYGNPNEESNHYQVGDQAELVFVDEYKYIDSRSGEPVTEDTPEEFVERKILKSHTKTYTICARVSMLHTMGYRFYGAEQLVLSSEEFQKQTNTSVIMSYLMNTDQDSNAAMESFLKDYTENVKIQYDYESKQFYVNEFLKFRNLFLLMGGLLSFILGIIGSLNFVNAVITSMISRKREFAVMQAVGMTGRQLKQVLMLEGCAYGIGAVLLATALNFVLAPVISNGFSSMFWFYSHHFTMLPILGIVPVFLILGCAIPLIAYKAINKQSIVDRIREAE